MKWSEDFETLLEFCDWLDRPCVLFQNSSKVIAMLRNPEDWTREYQFWQLWKEMPESCKHTREMIVDAVTEGEEMTADLVGFMRKHAENEARQKRHYSFKQNLFYLVFGVHEPEEETDD